MTQPLQPCLPFVQPFAPARDRFVVFDTGDVVGPEGRCRKLSSALRAAVATLSPETMRKLLPPLRDYLNLEMAAGEDWRSIWREGEGAAEVRQIAFYRQRGHTIGRRRPLDGAIALSHPKASYARFDRLAVQLLYDLLEQAELVEQNHSLVGFFAQADIERRAEYIKLLRDRGRRPDHIGRRFLAPQVRTGVSIPLDPRACADLLIEDLDRVQAPEIVRDMNEILRLNGKRPLAVLHANALGWAMHGARDTVACRNKGRGQGITEAVFVMPPDMEMRLRDRLASEPSPTSDGKTLLEEIEARRPDLRSSKKETKASAQKFLASVAIFPRPSARTSIDTFLTYDGLRYWTEKGRKARQSLHDLPGNRFSDGLREPTLRDYRRASITQHILELFARTQHGSPERLQGLTHIARLHDQSSDQSKTYADWAYQREALEAARQLFEKNGARSARTLPITMPEKSCTSDDLAHRLAHLAARERACS